MLKNSQFFVFVCEGSRQSKIIVLIAVSYTISVIYTIRTISKELVCQSTSFEVPSSRNRRKKRSGKLHLTEA